MKAKVIMVQGTMSNSGKSFITAGLCRVFAQDGYRTAPFKSQNMALNSYITKDGLEMGRAQVMQAEAAGIEPAADMNPILLKPTSHTGSQVIVNGRVRGQMKAMDYFRHKTELIPDIMAAYERLSEAYDIIVIEGAGSPAEINLKENDIVNMGLAKMVDAPVLLVGDIDRGGVFASLYGTVKLLEPEEQERIRGLIINKFRGDLAILKPGVRMIEDLVNIPVVGLVPMEKIDIDDEDSLSEHLLAEEMTGGLDAAVIRLPHISNFTDFTAFERLEGVSLRYVDRVSKLGSPHLILIPGTKNTMADLRWMRNNGLEEQVIRLSGDGVTVMGICGGYQMMGNILSDSEGVEEGGRMAGMGLLPVETNFRKEKVRTRIHGEIRCGSWNGCLVEGYEIHMGDSVIEDEGILANDSRTEDDEIHVNDSRPDGLEHIGSSGEFSPWISLSDGRMDGAINRGETVMGTYLHGIFDDGDFFPRFIDTLMERYHLTEENGAASGGDRQKFSARRPDMKAYKEAEYDRLADLIRKSLDMEKIYEIMGGRPNV